MIQTFRPDHYAVRCAMKHDFQTFFEKEMACRKRLSYPPLSHMACLLVQGPDKKGTSEAAENLGAAMRELLEGWPEKGREIRVLGPVEAPIARIKARHRWQLLTGCRSMTLMRHFLTVVEDLWKKRLRKSGTGLSIDIDPYNMM